MTKETRAVILTRPSTGKWALYPKEGPAILNEPIYEADTPAALRGYADCHDIKVVRA